MIANQQYTSDLVTLVGSAIYNSTDGEFFVAAQPNIVM